MLVMEATPSIQNGRIHTLLKTFSLPKSTIHLNTSPLTATEYLRML